MGLKILSLIEFLDPSFFGGSGKVLLETNLVFAEKGHSVHTICRTNPEKCDFGKKNNIFYDTYPDIDGNQLKKIKYYRKEIKKLFLEKTSDLKFDLIIIHSSVSCLGLESLLKSIDIPIIYYFHSPWHREYEIIARRKYCGIQSPVVKMLSFIRKRHEKKYINLAAGIVTLSKSMQDILLEEHPFVKDKKLLIDPGAANDSVYYPVRGEEEQRAKGRKEIKKEFSIPEDAFCIITSRRLVPRTGVDVLIKAFVEVKKRHGAESMEHGEEARSQETEIRREEHRTSNVQRPTSNEDNGGTPKKLKLILTGGGAQADSLNQLAVELGVGEDVIFTGHVSEEDLAKYYRCSDLFVMPTKFLEGFGLSTVEAMASGLPVIGTDIGGTPEILKKISEELIIPECSVDAIAEKINESIEKDDLDTWRERSINCFEENFTWQKHVDKLLGFAKNV